MEGEAATPIGPRVVLGLFAVVVGLLLTLDHLGLLRFLDYWRFWPLLLVAAGGLRMSQASAGPGRAAGFLLAALGLLLLLDRLGVLRLDLGRYWPLALVAIGIGLIWNSVGGTRPAPAAADEGRRLNLIAVLGGASRGSNAEAFGGGELTALLGGCEVDLRQASIGNATAVIDTFALCGAVHLRVPESWTVELRGTPVLGGFKDGTRPPVPPGPQRLVVTGWAILGGVQVTN